MKNRFILSWKKKKKIIKRANSLLCHSLLFEGRKAGKTGYKNPDFTEAAPEEDSHRGPQLTLK